jgi:hypothetical protein
VWVVVFLLVILLPAIWWRSGLAELLARRRSPPGRLPYRAGGEAVAIVERLGLALCALLAVFFVVGVLMALAHAVA